MPSVSVLFPYWNWNVLLVQPSAQGKNRKETQTRHGKPGAGDPTQAQTGPSAGKGHKTARRANEKEKWISCTKNGRNARKSKIWKK